MPIEIALRIVHAIDHDERFAAYLVIPLHPERPGPQRSSILLYTWHTIAMMYRYLQCLVLLFAIGHNYKHWAPVSAWLMLFSLLTVPALHRSKKTKCIDGTAYIASTHHLVFAVQGHMIEQSLRLVV